MKIIALNGSPRGEKSLTRRLLRSVLAGAAEIGAKVELVDVCALRLEYCDACDACHRGGKSPHKDDFGEVRARMLAAEGLVFGSPDYFRGVTAQMKTLIDRMGDVVHLQLFAGKYACCAATSGGPDHEEVTKYLSETLLNFGAYVVGSVGVSAAEGPAGFAQAEKRAAALGRRLAEDIAGSREYPDQAQRHAATGERFRQLVEMNKERWPYEYRHWQTLGGEAQDE